MFYPTKPGSDEYNDTMRFIKKLSYCIYNRRIRDERIKSGLKPLEFNIELENLDRFVKRAS